MSRFARVITVDLVDDFAHCSGGSKNPIIGVSYSPDHMLTCITPTIDAQRLRASVGRKCQGRGPVPNRHVGRESAWQKHSLYMTNGGISVTHGRVPPNSMISTRSPG